MKKITLILITIVCLFTSCSDEKVVYTNDGDVYKLEVYGLADKDKYKLEGVTYETVTGNVVWSIIGCETIVAPVVLLGWYLNEPIKVYDTALMIKSYEHKRKMYE